MEFIEEPPSPSPWWTLSENYLQTLHPIFPKGEAREDFEEIIDNLDEVSTTISAEFSLDAVISNVLADE